MATRTQRAASSAPRRSRAAASASKPGPKPVARTIAAFDPCEADRLCRRLLNSAHPKQRSAVEDDGYYVTFLCSRGAGKTAAEILRMLRKMIRIPKARCVYVATTRDTARELIWDDLKDIVERLGLGPDTGESRFNETRMSLTLTRNGSYLRLYGADDNAEIDKLRGKSFHEVGIDEAASHPPKILKDLIERVVGPRLGDKKGCIALFGTPGHILSGLFYDATRDDSPDHCPYAERNNPEFAERKRTALWSSHAWNLEDGAPHVPAIAALWQRALEDKEKYRWSDEHPVWRRERKGLWAADDTTNIYRYSSARDDWDPERIGPMRVAKLPFLPGAAWVFSLGADMGAADPFALQALAAAPQDPTRTLYHVFEFEAQPDAKMYAKRIAELLFGPDDRKNGVGVWPNHKKPLGLIGAIGWPVGAIADMSHLGEAILEELANVYGFRFVAGPRNAGDKLAAIELWNGDAIDGRIKILKGSKLAKQLGALQWKVDQHGKVAEDKSQPNHSADAGLMARGPLANIFEQYGAAAPSRSPLGARRQVSSPEDDEPAPRGDGDSFDGFVDDSFDGDGWGND